MQCSRIAGWSLKDPAVTRVDSKVIRSYSVRFTRAANRKRPLMEFLNKRFRHSRRKRLQVSRQCSYLYCYCLVTRSEQLFLKFGKRIQLRISHRKPRKIKMLRRGSGMGRPCGDRATNGRIEAFCCMSLWVLRVVCLIYILSNWLKLQIFKVSLIFNLISQKP